MSVHVCTMYPLRALAEEEISCVLANLCIVFVVVAKKKPTTLVLAMWITRNAGGRIFPVTIVGKKVSILTRPLLGLEEHATRSVNTSGLRALDGSASEILFYKNFVSRATVSGLQAHRHSL